MLKRQLGDNPLVTEPSEYLSKVGQAVLNGWLVLAGLGLFVGLLLIGLMLAVINGWL